MTFADIVAEMVSRGAEDNSTRNGRWANQAYQEIVNGHDWPFTEDDATGSAGAGTVAISDFRKALYVGDISDSFTPGRRLRKSSFDVLARGGVENLAETGSPEFWYLTQGPTTVKAFPVGGTIFVKYHFRTPDLSGVQVPIFDAAYHMIIVDRAMAEVYKDRNQPDEASDALRFYERGLARMIEEYGVDSIEHDYIDILDPYDG